MADYIALIRKESDSDYGVEFPDFPGCVTAGRTLDEAREFAAEALALHLEGMTEDGAPIPAPSSLEAIMTDAEARSAVAFLVRAPIASDKAVRVNITLPERMLAEIDAFARNHNTSRSAFLAQAAQRAMRSIG